MNGASKNEMAIRWNNLQLENGRKLWNDDAKQSTKTPPSQHSIMLSPTVAVTSSAVINESVCLAPVRDTSSLRNIKYGPGHEKHPSWPMTAIEEVPLVQRFPHTGSSHRSKSWTDQTAYPKEKAVVYSRPFMVKKSPTNYQTQVIVFNLISKQIFRAD